MHLSQLISAADCSFAADEGESIAFDTKLIGCIMCRLVHKVDIYLGIEITFAPGLWRC